MDDLIVFLRAQLDEDERIARAATPRYRKSENRSLWIHSDSAVIVTAEYFEDAAHIAAHDPARVLREIEAKRGIVDRYDFAAKEAARLATTGEDDEAWVRVAGALQSCVLCLAAVYADRPGFQESWRP